MAKSVQKTKYFETPLDPPVAHQRPEGLDPKVNGPFLDDIRRAEEDAYRKGRQAALNPPKKKAAAKKPAKKAAKKSGSRTSSKA